MKALVFTWTSGDMARPNEPFHGCFFNIFSFWGGGFSQGPFRDSLGAALVCVFCWLVCCYVDWLVQAHTYFLKPSPLKERPVDVSFFWGKGFKQPTIHFTAGNS